MTFHTDLVRLDYPALLLILVGITGVLSLYRTLKIRYAKKQNSTWKEPSWIEMGASFFSVLFLVFMLRSFFIEPFRVPSGSMEPSLLTGDFILVNKYTFGFRLPIFNDVFWPVNEPERGDVLVFHYPVDTHVDFIKRIVGIPGDHIHYDEHVLTINGRVVSKIPQGPGVFWDAQDHGIDMEHYTEALPLKSGGTLEHELYERPHFQGKGADVVVPQGYYFVMGDNRDDSGDSRFWGFVPERYIMGKAIRVWLSWDHRLHRIRWDRIGKKI